MIPGMTYWPFASITVAPSGAGTWGPISAILPSRMRMDPLGMGGRETGRITASFIIKTPDREDRCGSEARSHTTQQASTIIAIEGAFFILRISDCGLRIADFGFRIADFPI